MSRKFFISSGLVYIVLYVLLSAFSHVFVNHTIRSIDPIVTLFYSSVFTIIFFSILNLKELKKNKVLVKKNRTTILSLNILNCIIWFVIFYSLKVLSPAIFACLFLGAIPMILFFFELKSSTVSNKHNFIIGILLLVMFVLMLSLVYQDVKGDNFSLVVKYSAFVLLVGGTVAAFIMRISKKLAIENLSASLVVSLRFYGLLAISFIMIILNSNKFLVSLSVLAELFLLALISMALPLFLLQKALKTLSPLLASIIITAVPILTYFLQLITGYYLFSISKLGVIFLFSICLIVLTCLKKKYEIVKN